MLAAYNTRTEMRGSEPYVHCQSTHGKYSRRFGASRLPWLSGTATWSYHVATHHICGVRPEYDGLRIDPCIPSDWPELRVARRFRGATYEIEILNPDGVQKGVLTYSCVRRCRISGRGPAQVSPASANSAA